MIRSTRYLEWAIRCYGQVHFDLASSGMTPLPLAELGPLAEAASEMGDYASLFALRGAIARYHGVAEEEVLPALGTAHALWLAYASLLDPSCDVLIEEPVYEPLLRAAEATGARIIRFARSPDSGFAIDPAEVVAKITPRTRVVCVTNLHNPSGVRTSAAVLREVADVAAAAGAHLLVDEVYAPFDDLVDASGTWTGSARRVAANVIAVGSLTKCYGLGTQRIGWVLAPPEVVARATSTLLTTCGGLPTSHAAIGVRAFARIDAIAARARRLLGTKRAQVAAWAASHPGFTWSAPESGLFGFVRIPGAEGILGAVERGMAEEGVIVAPGEFFEVPDGFRIGWSLDAERLPEALARLDRVLAKVTP